MVNPVAGRETEIKLSKATRIKQVMVVGGGVGGMFAARIAALRGHKTVLYEKSSYLGGQVLLAAKVPGCSDLRDASTSLEWELNRSGVKVLLNTEVTLAMVKELSPDVLILATGAVPAAP
jgi:NADPH-dependent 2,4-dienoyl-CoA reductase/sulfur reductase-like enzyme